MSNKIYTALLIAFFCLGLVGCANSAQYSDKEYVISTADNQLQRKQIDLNAYRIDNSAIISLNDLISVNNMSLEMACFYDKDNLLLLYVNSDCTKLDVYLFSLIYGELQWQGRIENISGLNTSSVNYYPVSMKPLIIMENSTRKMWMIEDKTVQMEMLMENCSLGTTVGNDEGMFYIDKEDNSIKQKLYRTGTDKEIFPEAQTYQYEIRNLDYISADGKYLYATGINKLRLTEITFVIDIRNGKLISNIDGSFDNWDSGNAVYSSYLDNSEYCINKRENDFSDTVTEYRIKPLVDFDYILHEGDLVFTEENDGAIYNLGVYDLKLGQKIRSTQIDFGAYFRDSFKEAGGYSYCIIDNDYAYNSWRNMVVFEVVSESNNRKIFLWDINTANEESIDIPMDRYINEAVTDSIAEIQYEGLSNVLHSLYEQYGVGVYIGDNTPSKFTDYSADSNSDDYYMKNSVEQVMKVLEYYPKDFFKFFTTNNYTSGINIYLVGDMTPVTQGYIDSPSGFSTSMSDFGVMAVNIKLTDNIEQTLCHEISHAIYNRIKYEEFYSGNVYFDEVKWSELNPKGFEYYDKYVDVTESEDIKYTIDGYDEKSTLKDVYFVDVYSKTFLTEDLARLMEYNMVYSDNEFLDSPHLKNKMKFYSDAIRKVWNSEEWQETVTWEVNLNDE